MLLQPVVDVVVFASHGAVAFARCRSAAHSLVAIRARHAIEFCGRACILQVKQPASQVKSSQVKLNGARERVSLPPSLVGSSKGPLSRAGHLDERDAAPTGHKLFSRGVYVPSFSSPLPILCLTPRSISSRFPLRRKSGAHRLEISPLLLTYFFSEGTYVSTYDVSPHYGSLSAISAHSRPPLLASGAHSTGFRMVVCCLCIRLDLTPC